MERWYDCVIRELERVRSDLPAGRELSTIYFGGGTPSLLPVPMWRGLLAELEKLPRSQNCEFTAEANPESLDAEKLALWKDGGVTRVSLGIQSLNDAELKRIARPHTAADALKALELCVKNGFRASGDLIFGLPGQTLRDWHNSMSALAVTGIQHISIYQLSIEENSFWGRRPPENLPDGYPMYRWAQYYLPRVGLCQYEIASFAARGFESRHNMAYWRRTDVYAAGPAAWGFIDGRRFANCRDFGAWASRVEAGRSPIDYEERPDGAKAASEAAVLALRTSAGIDFAGFSARYGREWLDEILRRLDDLPQRYFCRRNGGIALSPRGMRVGNAIWTELMDLDERPSGR